MSNNKIYNSLSNKTNSRYNILYSEYKGNGITIIKTNEGFWGILKEVSKWGLFKSVIKVIDTIYDGTIYNKETDYLIGINFKEDYSEYFFFNMNGNFIKQIDAKNIRIAKGNIIIESIEDKMGVLDDQLNIIVPATYTALESHSKNIFIFSLNGLKGIVNHNNTILIEAVNLNILSYIEDVIIVEKEKNTFLQYTTDGFFEKKLPYSHVFLAHNNTYGVKNKEYKHKTVIDGVENEDFDEYDFDCLCKGKWGILNSKGEVQIPNIYDYIDTFRDPQYFKVGKGNLNFDEDCELFFTVKGRKFGVVDSQNMIIIPIEFDWIEEIEEGLWAVNKGGILYYDSDYQVNRWTAKGGKWGVVNRYNKLIVPVKYNCIMLNWYRVKDYIFVQNATESHFDDSLEYDVYNFEGNEIKYNKPNPRQHTYYPN